MLFLLVPVKKNLNKLNQLEKLKGCSGIKIFMGSSTGTLLLSEEKDLAIALKNCKRRVALHSEDEFRLKERFKLIDKKKGVSQHEIWRDKKHQLLYRQKNFEICK